MHYQGGVFVPLPFRTFAKHILVLFMDQKNSPLEFETEQWLNCELTGPPTQTFVVWMLFTSHLETFVCCSDRLFWITAGRWKLSVHGVSIMTWRNILWARTMDYIQKATGIREGLITYQFVQEHACLILRNTGRPMEVFLANVRPRMSPFRYPITCIIGLYLNFDYSGSRVVRDQRKAKGAGEMWWRGSVQNAGDGLVKKFNSSWRLKAAIWLADILSYTSRIVGLVIVIGVIVIRATYNWSTLCIT